MQRSSAFLIWKVAPRLRDLVVSAACVYLELPRAVSLLRRGCGMLPQHLELMYDVSDALEAHALASTWPYDLVSRLSPFRSSDLSSSRLELSAMTRWVHGLGRTSWMVTRWLRWLRYVAFRSLIEFLLTRSIFS